MKIQLEPLWSWPVMLLLAAGTLALVVRTYRRQARSLTSGRRWTLLGLRLAAWLVLQFVLLRPALEFTETDRKSSVFVIMTDNSRSMSVRDATGGLSRRQFLLQVLTDSSGPLKQLAADVDLRHFDFAATLTPVEAHGPETPGEQTALGNCLEDLLKILESRRVAGVLLIGDGAQRAMAPRNLDPRAAAQRFADLQIPIYTVPLGAGGLSEQAVDLAVTELQVNPTVFIKNTVVVSAKIKAQGAAGQDLKVSVFLEDRSGPKPEMKLEAAAQNHHMSQNLEMLPVEFTFTAENPGEQKVMVEVAPLQNEPQLQNNRLATFFSVLKGGIRVAYFDRAMSVEAKFIRRANESPEIKIDSQTFRTGNLSSPPGVEPQWFQQGRYDVYILGDIPASTFTPNELQLLARRVEGGAGLMMLGGEFSFGLGGYAETPLNQILPVTMRPDEKGHGFDPAFHIDRPLHMQPTDTGLRQFIMRLDEPTKNSAHWATLSTLKGANRFAGLKLGADLLAVSREGTDPLLVASEYRRGRVLAFACDTTFQWVLSGHRDEHQRFWQQVILWLARKDQMGDESVWMRLDARRYRAGQPVPVMYGARDSLKRPLKDVEFTVEVTGPEGFREQLIAQSGNQENVSQFLNGRRAGEYQFTVTGRRNGALFGQPAQGRFVIYEEDLELSNPAADPALLDEIARITLGKQVPPEQLPLFLKDLLRSGRLRTEVEKVTAITLWDNWHVIALFTTLLTAEWFLRKRRGLV